MLGGLNAYSFLKGWTYKKYKTKVATLTRGRTPASELFRENEEGILLWAQAEADDCYAEASIQFADSMLKVRDITYCAEDLRNEAKWDPDPHGYISRYYRPAQASTMGTYFFTMFNGYYGVPLPYYRSFVISTRLKAGSTQETGKIHVTCEVVAFKQKKDFIKSYRQFLAIKDLKIPEELLELT